METDLGIPIGKILARYHVTKRTFYYDLEIINIWLANNDFGTTEILNRVLFINTTKSAEIKKAIENCQYYFSTDERKILEFFYIALSNKPVNINTFQKLFDVSKNTIATDIRKLKESFEHDKILLYSKPIQGYFRLCYFS